ncbi:MAG: WD40/YVTN/BNR-like repeat-containing protein, partial [Pirellulaceae bacterium]
MWNRAHGIRRHLVHRANGLARRRGALEQLEPRLAMAAIQDWQPRGAGGGGALFSPSINPSNPSEIYIASDMGQVFHTTDAGTDWDTVDHRELHGSNNARVHFTVDPALRYALDYAQGGDVVRPARSTDGGHTWTPLSADPTSGEAISLLVDYRNPQRLLISDYRRLWISTDGGATFQLRFSTSASDGLHLGGAFFDGNAIFVGTNQGVLVSTNNDGSFQVAPWSGIPTDQRIVSFAGAAENGTTRFWAVTAAAGDVYGGVQGWEHGGFRGIYTIDAGQTAWRASTSGLTSGATPFFVAAALNDVDSVYVSGGSNASRPTVFRSTDGGNTWQSVLLTAGNANVATAWAGDGGVRGWSYGENAL